MTDKTDNTIISIVPQKTDAPKKQMQQTLWAEGHTERIIKSTVKSTKATLKKD